MTHYSAPAQFKFVSSQTDSVIQISQKMIIKFSKLFRLSSRRSKSKCSKLKEKNLTKGRCFESEYVLERVIGRGGFGTVHKAIRKSDDLEVAVKIVPKDQSLVPLEKTASTENVPVEVVMLRQVSDVPGVVKLLDYFETTSSYLIVMEMFTSCDLFDLISQCGHLTEDVAQEIFGQIVESLIDCKSRQVLHGDIKVGCIYFKQTKNQQFLSTFRMKMC